MQSLFQSSNTVQQAALEATASSWKIMSDYYVWLLGKRSDFYQHDPSHHRSDDLGQHTSETDKATVDHPPFNGSDFSDHYGKRSLDVDVEHM